MWSRGFARLCCLPSPNLSNSIGHQSLMSATSLPLSSSSSYYSSCCCNRRTFTVSTLSTHLPLAVALFLGTCPPSASASASAEEEDLDRYTDNREGFTLLKPTSWTKVDKVGATALFKDPTAKANSIGVVVNPVRISSLTDFGSPSDVADKLIQAERRKESTKGAEVIQVRERTAGGGFPVYEFEYKVDSTRGGVKRIFSAAFVASKKLYLLNISHSDSQASPLNPQTKLLLEKVLGSFDLST
ncbi:PsbP domain-containing protein 2 [Nymphaea thermarum]|nr:PsbP domain-containing protein 2 [Nymphaea thermarum]